MKNIEIVSERLVIKPRTIAQMEELYSLESDSELKQAYSEMLELMKSLPGREEWAGDWAIMHRGGQLIGGIGFKGVPDKNGKVEIGYGIDEPFRRMGYATEAVSAVVRWAFEQGVSCVQAQTEPDNEISQRVLSANGFIRAGFGEEGPMFEIYKAQKEE